MRVCVCVCVQYGEKRSKSARLALQNDGRDGKGNWRLEVGTQSFLEESAR